MSVILYRCKPWMGNDRAVLPVAVDCCS